MDCFATSQETARKKIDSIIAGLQTSLKKTDVGVKKFNIKAGFVWKLFKAGKQLSELTDLNTQIKIKFQELKDWFVVSIKTEISEETLATMEKRMEKAMERAMKFPLEQAVNNGLHGTETETERAQGMKDSEGLIVDAGVPKDHMKDELDKIKEILERVEEKVDRLLDDSVFMLVIVRLPVSTRHYANLCRLV